MCYLLTIAVCTSYGAPPHLILSDAPRPPAACAPMGLHQAASLNDTRRIDDVSKIYYAMRKYIYDSSNIMLQSL